MNLIKERMAVKYKSKKKSYSAFYRCPECKRFKLAYANTTSQYASDKFEYPTSSDEQTYWCDHCAFVWVESDLTDHLEE